MSAGTLHVNMKQMDRWKVTSDNVRWFDSIVCTGGEVSTLDMRPYVEFLCEFNIFYTATHDSFTCATPNCPSCWQESAIEGIR